MKNKFTITFLILLLFTIFFIKDIYANPVASWVTDTAKHVDNNVSLFDYFINIYPLFILIYFISSLIEFGIAYLFLKRYIKKKTKLLNAILIINLITFPITQYLALLFSGVLPYFSGVDYIAELFPIIAEFFLLRWQLNKLYKNRILSNKVSDKIIFATTTVMNLVTFLLGWMLSNVMLDTLWST